MLFTSFHFILVFFPIVLAVSAYLRGQNLLRWIAVSSLVFYAMEGQPWFLIPMCITTVLDFAIAIQLERIESMRTRNALLLLSLCGNLGMLIYFEYGGLFVATPLKFGQLSNTSYWALWFSVVLPAGISFYTFQTLSYIIDVYRKEAPAEKNFWKFFSFVPFFPHFHWALGDLGDDFAARRVEARDVLLGDLGPLAPAAAAIDDFHAAVEAVGHNVPVVKERVLLEADINKGGFEAVFEVAHLAFEDAADEALFGRPLDGEFLEPAFLGARRRGFRALPR